MTNRFGLLCVRFSPLPVLCLVVATVVVCLVGGAPRLVAADTSLPSVAGIPSHAPTAVSRSPAAPESGDKRLLAFEQPSAEKDDENNNGKGDENRDEKESDERESDEKESDEKESDERESDERESDVKSQKTSQESETDEDSQKAKFQIVIPSTQALFVAHEKSRIGRFARHFSDVLRESRMDEMDEMDETGGMPRFDLLAAIARWPDVRLEIAMYAPDIRDQPRWAARVGMPVGQLHDLIADLASGDEFSRFFEGLEVQTVDGEFRYVVAGETLAILKSLGSESCILRSHSEVELPPKFFQGTKGDTTPIITARLEIKGTEKDSDASFFSKFSIVNSLDYTARIDDAGVWKDELRAGWPLLSGLTMKALLGTPRQTFFVPKNAFISAVIDFPASTTFVDQSAGLMLKGDSASPGPIQQHAASEVLLTLLPGDGFLPVPEIVAQCRVLKPDALLNGIADQTKRINRADQKQDKRATWHEAVVEGHRVFWCDLANSANRGIAPFLMRPVLFVQRAEDARDRKRDYLIVGWTSTNPVRFVTRWLGRPRASDEIHFLPESRDNNIEALVHWQEIYDWVHPYVNLSLASVSPDAILTDELGRGIAPAKIAGEIKLGGMIVSHRGPVPLGLIAIPAMASSGTNRAKNSDLARERIARHNLKVLHHHATLFHKDTGRWPVTVAELDGYIDFESNPNLLEIRESSRERWGKLFSTLLGKDEDDNTSDKEEGEESDDELYAEIDDSIYEIGWQGDVWRLGFAPGQIDHLDQLYIDMNGVLHRVNKDKEHES